MLNPTRSPAFVAALAALALTAVAACTPPHGEHQLIPAAQCVRSTLTGRPFVVGPTGCGPDAIHVDEPCGPLLPTAAEDDVCVSYWRASDGSYRFGPLSAVTPDDRVIATFR